MNEDVYFNEPSYERLKNSQNGKLSNTGYSNIVKYSNVKYCMNQMLRYPLPNFKEIIIVHFYLKKDIILRTVEDWIREAEEDKTLDPQLLYGGLVETHNRTLAI